MEYILYDFGHINIRKCISIVQGNKNLLDIMALFICCKLQS